MTEFALDLSGIKPVNPNPYPFTPLQLNWLNALEKGNHKQGQGLLCSGQDEYCCLGVLAELTGANKQFQPLRGAYRFFLSDEKGISGGVGLLSYGMRKMALLKSDMGDFAQPVVFPGLAYDSNRAKELAVIGGTTLGHTSLASMNDVRMIPKGDKWRAFTFKEIAKYIRHDPWNVFNPPEDLIQAAFDNTPPWLEGAENVPA